MTQVIPENLEVDGDLSCTGSILSQGIIGADFFESFPQNDHKEILKANDTTLEWGRITPSHEGWILKIGSSFAIQYNSEYIVRIIDGVIDVTGRAGSKLTVKDREVLTK